MIVESTIILNLWWFWFQNADALMFCAIHVHKSCIQVHTYNINTDTCIHRYTDRQTDRQTDRKTRTLHALNTKIHHMCAYTCMCTLEMQRAAFLVSHAGDSDVQPSFTTAMLLHIAIKLSIITLDRLETVRITSSIFVWGKHQHTPYIPLMVPWWEEQNWLGQNHAVWCRCLHLSTFDATWEEFPCDICHVSALTTIMGQFSFVHSIWSL